MPETMEQAAKESLARATTTTLRLRAVEFAHSSMPGGAMRVCDYTSDISVGGSVYAGIGMEVSEPGINIEPGATFGIRMDTTAGTVQFYFNQANIALDTILCKITAFLYDSGSDSVDSIIQVYNLEVLKSQFGDNGSASMELGYLSIANKDFPSINYSPDSHPQLYR